MLLMIGVRAQLDIDVEHFNNKILNFYSTKVYLLILCLFDKISINKAN